MSTTSTAILRIDPDEVMARARRKRAAYVELTKPGITRLVTITAFPGFALVALMQPRAEWAGLIWPLLGSLLGIALSAAGANALNMWWEADRDALMRRTEGRPIPVGMIPPKKALKHGTLLGIAGTGVLMAAGGPEAALLALLSLISYVFVYTPLKTRSGWCTIVGAVPGALPPMIGAAAASPHDGVAAILEPIGLALFAVMFLWQLPHFWAIAWMYRDDYARGGMRMISVRDGSGVRTATAMLATTALLVPVSLTPSIYSGGLLGVPYLATATLLGVGFLLLAARFARKRDDASAKHAFLGSIAYLPLVLLAACVEAGVRTALA